MSASRANVGGRRVTRVRRRLLLACAGGAVLLLMGLSIAFGHEERGTRTRALPQDARFYVDPESHAAQQERRWLAEGRVEDAEAIRAISRRPGAQWYGEPDTDPTPVEDRVARLTERAAGAGAIPVIVIYSVPFRDCGSFSSGGSGSAAAYERYVRRIASGIGARPAVVVLEPDALGHVANGCVKDGRARERIRLVREAIRVLGAGSRTTVYLDAGNAGFVSPSKMAPLLERAGVDRADGFAVNVANFHTTRSSVAHGQAISRRIDGKPFVVDTSRNGRGPWRSDDPQTWCNPPGRALGTPPTADTGLKGVDGFLWIKSPGDSDGTCRSGPPAGQWWPEHALELARAPRG